MPGLVQKPRLGKGDVTSPGTDRSGSALVAAFLALQVVVVWLPDGLGIGPNNDIWIASGRMMRGLLFAGDPDRPLWPWIHVIAHHFTPDSYEAHQLLMALLFFARGILVFLVARRLLHGDAGPAFLVAGIALFHPADLGWFPLSHLSLHLSLVLSLFSVWLLVHWLDEGGRWQAPLAAVSLVFALWTYEAYVGVLLAAPVLLPWWTSAPRSRRRRALVWLAVPASYLLWRLALALQGLTGVAGITVDLEPGAVAARLASALRYCLWSGWFDTTHLAEYRGFDRPAVAAVWLLAGGLTWRLARRSTLSAPLTRKRWAFVVFWGIALVVLGFAPYAVSRMGELLYRTVMLASLGGSVAAVGALGVLTGRRWRRGFWLGVLGGALVASSTCHGVRLRHKAADASLRQHAMLATLVEQAPALRPESLLVILPAEDRLFPVFPQTNALVSAIRFLYADTILEVLAFVDESHFSFEDERILLFPQTRHPRSFHPSQLLVFDCSQADRCQLTSPVRLGGSPRHYRPRERILKGAVPERACRLLHTSVRPAICSGG